MLHILCNIQDISTLISMSDKPSDTPHPLAGTRGYVDPENKIGAYTLTEGGAMLFDNAISTGGLERPLRLPSGSIIYPTGPLSHLIPWHLVPVEEDFYKIRDEQHAGIIPAHLLKTDAPSGTSPEASQLEQIGELITLTAPQQFKQLFQAIEEALPFDKQETSAVMDVVKGNEPNPSENTQQHITDHFDSILAIVKQVLDANMGQGVSVTQAENDTTKTPLSTPNVKADNLAAKQPAFSY